MTVQGRVDKRNLAYPHNGISLSCEKGVKYQIRAPTWLNPSEDIMVGQKQPDMRGHRFRL